MNPPVDTSAIFIVSVMARWASWRLASGNQLLGRLIVHADMRAVSWFVAWRLVDVVGPAVVIIAIVATAALTSTLFRRYRYQSSTRHSSSHHKDQP